MEKKYKLGKKEGNLYCIVALKDFSDVKKGDIGGLIEKESNLSQSGNCWVYCDAQVYNDAILYENAVARAYSRIFEYAIVHGNAVIYGVVHGNSVVYGNAVIYGDIFENAVICGDAKILGDERAYKNLYLYHKIKIPGEGNINHPKHYISNGIEAIDIIEAFNLNFHLGNAIKYILRAGKKTENISEDIGKAMWYLNRYLDKEFPT